MHILIKESKHKDSQSYLLCLFSALKGAKTAAGRSAASLRLLNESYVCLFVCFLACLLYFTCLSVRLFIRLYAFLVALFANRLVFIQSGYKHKSSLCLKLKMNRYSNRCEFSKKSKVSSFQFCFSKL